MTDQSTATGVSFKVILGYGGLSRLPSAEIQGRGLPLPHLGSSWRELLDYASPQGCHTGTNGLFIGQAENQGESLPFPRPGCFWRTNQSTAARVSFKAILGYGGLSWLPPAETQGRGLPLSRPGASWRGVSDYTNPRGGHTGSKGPFTGKAENQGISLPSDPMKTCYIEDIQKGRDRLIPVPLRFSLCGLLIVRNGAVDGKAG